MRQASRRAGVFDELAQRLRMLVQDEAANTSSGVSRFKVLAASPLRVQELHGELVLEEGDPDFTVGKALAASHPAVGDMVWVARSDGQVPEFHAFDMVG